MEVDASMVGALSRDLREFVTRKRSVTQITLQYYCKWIISHFTCHCGFRMMKPLIFYRLIEPTIQQGSPVLWKRDSYKKKPCLESDWPVITSNMIGKGKPAKSMEGDSSDLEFSGSWKKSDEPWAYILTYSNQRWVQAFLWTTNI